MIIHIDMDAFFASVEIRAQPTLADKPVVVGGRPEGRGVVAAASYAARRFGIHSAMPMATARRLCPELVILPPRLALYAEVSQQIQTIFARYTPIIEPLSLDEAFLDVSASRHLFGPATAIGRRIKQDIHTELRLIASVGVAPNKFLAKLASDLDKPDGFVEVMAAQVQSFLDPLPVSRLWGAGKAAQGVFQRLGIQRMGQLRRLDPATLTHHFGKQGLRFLDLARGIDPRPVIANAEAKSVSHETTFEVDIADRDTLRAVLFQLTEQVAWRLRQLGLRGRTVHLKVRFPDFHTLTRSHTLPTPTHTTDTLWQTVRRLFDTRLPPSHPPLRLIGMGVSGFDADSPPPPSRQGELFTDTDAGAGKPAIAPAHHGQEALDRITDHIRARFGRDALHRATSLPPPATGQTTPAHSAQGLQSAPTANETPVTHRSGPKTKGKPDPQRH